jgi:hypothetical protein
MASFKLGRSELQVMPVIVFHEFVSGTSFVDVKVADSETEMLLLPFAPHAVPDNEKVILVGMFVPPAMY